MKCICLFILKIVATPSTVVGVVGIGHVPGIKERWGNVKDEDIPAIMQ